ncbi:MAG: porin family protein [Muribaculaceae bacterium]|nr:porin family protein [Muribaculaceae bacterium]MBQ2562346.1 porin family protein [Muribaculaceae bacterium]
MKSSFKIIVIIAIVAIAVIPAQGQVRFGVKGGITINELKWDKNILSSENKAGFTGGLMLEVGLPVVGLGIDGSVLYAHRENEMYMDGIKLKRDYIDFPINVKYKIQIPVISKIFAPFVSTGPDFALLLSDSDTGDFKTRKWNTSWNVGFGAELFRKLQIHANYGIGLTKAFEYINKEVESTTVKGKDKYWTITAAYLF